MSVSGVPGKQSIQNNFINELESFNLNKSNNSSQVKSNIGSDNLLLNKKSNIQKDPFKQKDLTPVEARAKVASEHGITLKPEDNPLVDTHGDRSLHGEKTGILAKPFDKVMHLFAPNWGPHITEENLVGRGLGAQIMSVPTDGLPPFYFSSQALYSDLVAGRPDIASETRLNRLVDQTAYTYRMANKYPEHLTIAWSYNDIKDALNSSKTALMPAIEGAMFLEPRKGTDNSDYNNYETKLRYFLAHPESGIPDNYPLPTSEEIHSTEGLIQWSRRMGVVYIGLNHLGSNQFSGSDLGIGKGDGLSEKGKEVIKLMDKYGILLDLAHASQATQKEIKNLKLELPILVSHGVVATAGEKANWRDTRPEVLDEIKRTDGIFGVMFATQYLPNGTIEDIVDQIKTVKNRIGIEHIAIGTDADGFVNLAIKDMAGVGQVLDALRKEGFSEEDIARITFGNFLNMLKKRDEILEKRGTLLDAPNPNKPVITAYEPQREKVIGVNIEGGMSVYGNSEPLYGGTINFETTKYHTTDPYGNHDKFSWGYTGRVGAFGNENDWMITAAGGIKFGTTPHNSPNLKFDVNLSGRMDYSTQKGLMVGPELGFNIGTNVPDVGNLYIRPYVGAMTNFKEVTPVAGISLGIGFDIRNKTKPFD